MLIINYISERRRKCEEGRDGARGKREIKNETEEETQVKMGQEQQLRRFCLANYLLPCSKAMLLNEGNQTK